MSNDADSRADAPGRPAAPLRPLTDKKRRFVEEYLVDANATHAAIRAGYSERTARQAAYELIRMPEVASAIMEAMDARSMRTKIDADWVLAKLRDMFEADVADLYDRHGRLLPVKDWPKIWRTGGMVTGLESVETVDLAVESDPSDGKPRARRTLVANKKIRWADRIKLLELIGKHVDVGAFLLSIGGGGGGGGGGGAPTPAEPQRPLASFTDEELEANLHRRIALRNGNGHDDGTPPANGHR